MPALYTPDRVTTPRAVLTNLGVDIDAAPIHEWIRDRHLDVPVVAFGLVASDPWWPLGRTYVRCGDLPVFASLHEVAKVAPDRPRSDFRARPVAPLYLAVEHGLVTLVMGAPG